MNKEDCELCSYTATEYCTGGGGEKKSRITLMKVEHKESEVEKLSDHSQKVGNLYFLNFAIVFKNTNVTTRNVQVWRRKQEHRVTSIKQMF